MARITGIPYTRDEPRGYNVALLSRQDRMPGYLVNHHQIAATALAYGCEIVTGKLSHFRPVQGLKVVAPRWPS